nr:hypothetical protein SYMBAF_50275 [Serratia symbiotica]
MFGDSLTLHDYQDQVAEVLAIVRALNKMTKAGRPKVYALPERRSC